LSSEDDVRHREVDISTKVPCRKSRKGKERRSTREGGREGARSLTDGDVSIASTAQSVIKPLREQKESLDKNVANPHLPRDGRELLVSPVEWLSEEGGGRSECREYARVGWHCHHRELMKQWEGFAPTPCVHET
jgi:hypothetical protein